MGCGEPEIPRRGGIGSEPISSQPLGRHALLLEQLPHRSESRSFVPLRLDQHVQDLALAINSTPQIHAPTADREEHLVEVPSAIRRATLPPQLPCDQRTEAADL